MKLRKLSALSCVIAIFLSVFNICNFSLNASAEQAEIDKNNILNFSQEGIDCIKNLKLSGASQKAELIDDYLDISIDSGYVSFGLGGYELKSNTGYKVIWEYNITENSNLSNGGLFAFPDKEVTGSNSQIQDSKRLYTLESGYTTNSFVKEEFVFKTSSVGNLAKNLGMYLYAGKLKMQIKSFSIISLDNDGDEPAVGFANGGFENEKAGWTDENGAATLSQDAYSGSAALGLKGISYSHTYQKFFPNTNTNYEISFWYKGATSGIINWFVSHDELSYKDDCAIARKALEPASQWTQVKTVISSDTYESLYFVFRTVAGDDFTVDNITITETTDAADELLSLGTAPHIIESYDPKNYNGENSLETFDLYISNPEDNLITDYSFENGNGNWNSDLMFATEYLSVVDYAEARTGNKVLKFEAHDLETPVRASFFVDVEPNTDYYFLTMAKGELWSDTNTCDLHFGIADCNTGVFLTDSVYASHTETKQLITCFDGAWHSERVSFNSGSAEKIAISFYGADSTAYFDDMYLFKAEDKVKYQFPYQSTADITVTSSSPQNNAANENDNLFDNSDLSDINDLYWSKGTSFKINGLSISPTNSSAYGNALHYTAATYVTGVPKQSYYIKWVDVEPNTEYTFSAEYFIETEGNGYFGIMNGNSYYPTVVASVSFKDKALSVWNKAAFSFNTGGYDKIAFIVFDNGGSVFIDNLCLVEASKAILSDSAVNTVFDFSEDGFDRLINIKQPAEQTDTNYLKNENGLLKLRTFWAEKTFAFDYILQPNSQYKLVWEYRITGNAPYTDRWSGIYRLPTNTIVGDGYANTDNDSRLIKLIEHGYVTTDFVTEEFTFTTGDLSDGNNRFGFITSAKNLQMEIKYISIERIVDEPKYISFDGNKDVPSVDYISSNASVKYNNEIKGNRYLELSANKELYEIVAFRTDIELEPNTYYTLSFMIKGNCLASGDAYISAGNGTSSWNFYSKPYVNGSDKDLRQACLLGEDKTFEYNDKTYSYRDGSFAINGEDAWHNITVDFNTGSVVDSTNKYLTFVFKFFPGSNRYVCYDEIVLQKSNGSKANEMSVLLNMGYKKGVKYADADSLTALETADGYIFENWYSDVERETPYQYSESVELPVMIYAGYTIDANGDGICNIRDLVRMKKAAADEKTLCTVAADCNFDGVISAEELSYIKKMLLNLSF